MIKDPMQLEKSCAQTREHPEASVWIRGREGGWQKMARNKPLLNMTINIRLCMTASSRLKKPLLAGAHNVVLPKSRLSDACCAGALCRAEGRC